MFCYQCEQTGKDAGCHAFGNCGKDPETAALQDLLVYGLRGLSQYAYRAAKLGAQDRALDIFTLETLFLTVTNVNFDVGRHVKQIQELNAYRNRAKELYEEACKKANVATETFSGPATIAFASDLPALIRQGEAVSPDQERKEYGPDEAGLRHLVLYGLKGMVAYQDHAHILGADDDSIYAFVHKVLSDLSGPLTVDQLLALSLEVGEQNLGTLGHLDRAHTTTYGIPVPTKVSLAPVAGKAILVSGHDMKDLEELLKQTEGTGINIYTHGEMLPAHGYPKLKAYKHLAGNYGGAWQEQREEFEAFPGPIVMTTNCIQKPKDSYLARIFTCGMVGWPGAKHLINRNYKPVIDSAKAMKGFERTELGQTITVGFGHQTVTSIAGTVVDAVKKGAIKHFFVVGGCDGAKSGRNYFTDIVKQAPQDTVVLTLGCGKYRFNKEELGEIGGIPRLLDLGQCNDAYSAIQIALALSKAFNVGVNELPLSLVVSWFEQKAVAVLLTLLHLGIKDIRLGPSLPAFVTPAALNILVDKFGIKPVGATAEEDLKTILQPAA